MPGLSSYPPAAALALARVNASQLFLQTATPTAVAAFEAWGSAHGVQVAYTDNERAVHDLWMRRDNNSSGCIGNISNPNLCRTQAGQRASVVAQAVNAWIASRASVFVSPAASMWTKFVEGLIRRRGVDSVEVMASAADKRLRVIHRRSGAGAMHDNPE